MKKLFLTMTALLAVFITATAQEAPSIQMGQTLYLRAAQGEQTGGSASSLISRLGYNYTRMSQMTKLYLVRDLSLLTKDNDSISFGNADNYTKITFDNDGNAFPTGFPVSLNRFVSQSGNNVSFYWLQVSYEGRTREESQDFYLVSDLSEWNGSLGTFEIKGIAIPIHVETYNSFRYLDYPSIVGTDFENYSISSSERETVYLAKETGEGYKIAGCQTNIPNLDGITGSEEKAVSLFSVFTSETLNKGKELYLYSTGQSYALTDEDSKLYIVYDESQGYGSNYRLKAIDMSDLDWSSWSTENPSAMPLALIPQSDGTCVIRTASMVKQRWVEEPGSEGYYEDYYAYIYLDYNLATGSLDLVYEPTANETQNFDENHKLLLYHAVLREDNTPHFQPYNGQVTSIHGGQAETTFEDEVDPLVIEMTFDRPLKTAGENFQGEVLGVDGQPLSSSTKFKVIVTYTNDDGTTTTIESGVNDNEDTQSAPMRANGPLKGARKGLISSTSVKTVTENNVTSVQSNVAVVTLNADYLPVSSAASAPQMSKGPLKGARKGLISSTSVKVVASNNAIGYANAAAVMSSPKHAPQRANSLAEENGTTPFAFEYVIDKNDAISDGGRINVHIGADGLATYYANDNNALNVSSTDQLKFYKA